MSQKKLSLQEQLLQAGLATSAKLKSAKTEKHKQNRLQRNTKAQLVDEAKALASMAQAEKLERDRELNKLKQQEEEKKQIGAQVRQLIEQHRVTFDEDEIDRYDDSSAYHFSDNNRVKKLFVPDALRKQIASGRLAIVKSGQRYEIVAADIAEKIRARSATSIMVLNEPRQTRQEGDDPYARYQIPDDLTW
ncbi:MAG: DUF2058 domain-containing protein [Gammaproteobacteria bacterium]